MSYNDIEAIADNMVNSYFSGNGLFDSIAIYETVTLADITKRLAEQLDCDNTAISVILPA